MIDKNDQPTETSDIIVKYVLMFEVKDKLNIKKMNVIIQNINIY